MDERKIYNHELTGLNFIQQTSFTESNGMPLLIEKMDFVLDGLDAESRLKTNITIPKKQQLLLEAVNKVANKDYYTGQSPLYGRSLVAEDAIVMKNLSTIKMQPTVNQSISGQSGPKSQPMNTPPNNPNSVIQSRLNPLNKSNPVIQPRSNQLGKTAMERSTTGIPRG